MSQQPTAPYYIAQVIVVQEQALHTANEPINALEQQMAALSVQASASQRGGLFSSLFGGGKPAAPAPMFNSASTQPQVASGYDPRG